MTEGPEPGCHWLTKQHECTAVSMLRCASCCIDVGRHAMLNQADDHHAQLLQSPALHAAHQAGHVTQAAGEAAAGDTDADTAVTDSQLKDLSILLILHILDFLPDSCKAWAGKRVCRAAYHQFKDLNRINPACSNLPNCPLARSACCDVGCAECPAYLRQSAPSSATALLLAEMSESLGVEF